MVTDDSTQKVIRDSQAFQTYFFTAALNLITSVGFIRLIIINSKFRILTLAALLSQQYKEAVQEGLHVDSSDGRPNVPRTRIHFCSEVIPSNCSYPNYAYWCLWSADRATRRP